jgi:hypothetical protein
MPADQHEYFESTEAGEVTTHSCRDRLRDEVSSILKQRVSEPTLLMYDPHKVALVVSERCRRLAREALNTAKSHILVMLRIPTAQ